VVKPYTQAPVPAGEAAAIARVRRAVERIMEDSYATTRPVLRGQHPKTHGCVKAELIVGDDVPRDLARGIFSRPRTYDAWVRFSSSALHPKPDYDRDAHGAALKVMGVSGPRAYNTAPSDTQDFLFVNDPVFFCRDALEYADFAETVERGEGGSKLRAVARTSAFFLGPNRRTFRPRQLANLARVVSRKVDNPLDIRYWSQTPYLLGTRPVKYSLKPVPGPPVDGAAKDGAQRLAEALARTLRFRDARFELQAQRWIDEATTPVEDPTVRWDESVSPFMKVATVHIPSQDAATQERFNDGEVLSFTPWHSLEAHKPLGGINRARQAAYDASAALRERHNGVTLTR
jgi:Catalase